MRILRLGILNLNSLRGRQTIDFTTSPLADHQLYAIVGPTGAGKTTILDAITLALYGQTERNKSEKDRKDGSGSVMTYGEGDCYAELEYETAHGRYKNRWSRQRAHKKPDRDLTASRREIAKWNPETEDWDILATKKREVDQQTESVVGLDYERFVRSVMLTQGDFARFLKSDPGDKAAILEKITGTAVYKELSMAAYTRAKLAREDWERATDALAAAPPMDSEARKDLEEQLAEKRAKIAPLKQDLTTVVGQLNLHANLLTLEVKATAAAEKHTRLEEEWTALEADRQRLAASEELQPLRADLEGELRLGEEQRKTTASLEAVDREAAAAGEELHTASAAVATAGEKLNTYYEKLPGREKKFDAVAQLEQDINRLLRDTELDRKRLESLRKSHAEWLAKQRQLNREMAPIVGELAGFQPADIHRQLEEAEASVPALAASLEQLDGQIARRATQDRLTAALTATGALEKELTILVAQVKENERLAAAAETSLTDRRAMLNNLRVSASLSEHKTNLQPGEECPVCGATEHPGLKDFVAVSETAIERSQRDVNQALNQYEAAKRALDAARQSESAKRRKFDGQQALVKELQQQLGPDAPPETAPVAELTAQRAAATDRLQQATTEQARLRRLQSRLPGLTALETQASGARERLKELSLEITRVEGTLEKADQAIAKKRATIKAEIGDRTAEECRELTRRKKDELTAKLAAAEKAEVDARGKQAAVASRRTVLQQRLDQITEELAAVRERLRDQLGDQPDSIAIARAKLLPEADARELRASLQRLDTARETAATIGKNLTEELNKARAELADVPTREVLEQQRTEREHTISEADRLIGALELQLRQDDERIAEIAAGREALAGVRKEADRWQRLSDLIGSADGKKFRSYAQAITLQQLITIGNDHLGSINPRYRMEYAPPDPGTPERLDMVIIDQYQNDNRRTMATLSGGESFLISLALALGLSDLASGKSLIRSLFIDEGFGTLDGKTLDQAMTTLEQLQAQGKTIGLISHVPQLRERIYCQIQLERVGDGFSKIKVRG